MKITLKRRSDAFHFEAENETNLTVSIDGSPEIGGENKGFTPMQLMLSGIASCSTIDLLLILKKQKQEVVNICIEAEAERTTIDSKKFKSINLHYILSGNLLNSKVERAINLAVTKYCSAILSLDPSIKVSASFEVE